jgi:transposase
MLEKKVDERNQVECICIEEFVPKDHMLRKIDHAVDFNMIYEMVSDLYCPDNGRLSIDPVVLFKIVIIQHLFSIPSLRRTSSEIEMNLAYRWFLGYGINEKTPHLQR